MPKYTQDLKLISQEDQESFGQIFSRNRHLNSLGLPTTNGFVIGFSAFDQALAEVKPKLRIFIQEEFNSTEKLKAFEKLLPPNLSLHSDLKTEIENKLKQLKSPFLIRAATRNAEGRETITFETVVKNSSETYAAIISAWSSFIYNVDNLANAIEKASVCVCIIQKNQPDVSGRAFILGSEDSRIEIQAQWGEFKPTEKSDVAKLNTKTLLEESYLISPQRYQLLYKDRKYESIKVSEKFQNSRKLNLDQAEKIAKSLKKLQLTLATSIELGFEIVDSKIILEDLNFNIEKGKKSQNIHIGIDLPTFKHLKPLLPGIVSGFGKIIENSSDLNKLQRGDIAILNNLKKEYLPALKKASGIVVQNSQNLSNQLLPKLQSLGITAVEGTIKILPKQVLTLNGKTGRVYLGAFAPLTASKMKVEKTPITDSEVKSATKVFVTLNNNSFTDLKNPNIDGIGPLRPEIFFTRFGIHPKALIKKSEFHQVSQDIKNHLTCLCSLMSEKPVIYQVSDFKTNELIHLSQGENHETAETNPFLGKRGAFRHLQNPEIIKAELDLIKSLRNKDNFKNLWISIPFIRTKAELTEIKKIVSQSGLNRSPSFKLLVTISTPANIYSIEDLISEGIDGCLIDYYDLANLLYGKDFSYSELVNLQDDAIIKALQEIIKPLNKAKLFSGIFNFPPEISSKLFKDVVNLGIRAVGVNEIDVDQAKKELSSAEKQLVAKSNS